MKERTLARVSIKGVDGRVRRRHSVQTKKWIVQYWLSGIKPTRQLYQEYGIDRNLLWSMRRWYHRHFERMHYSPIQKRNSKMQSEHKALRAKIKELEATKTRLEKQLDWERTKNLSYEKMLNMVEEELAIPIRKKLGAEPSKK